MDHFFGVWCSIFKVGQIWLHPFILCMGNIGRLVVRKWSKKWLFQRNNEHKICRKLYFWSSRPRSSLYDENWRVWIGGGSNLLPVLNRLKNRPPQTGLSIFYIHHSIFVKLDMKIRQFLLNCSNNWILKDTSKHLMYAESICK